MEQSTSVWHETKKHPSVPPSPTRTRTHTRTQHVVGPQFHLSQYQATEGETEVVRLSAPILTRPQVPAFSGRIEVDITAEDLPSSDPRQNAQFGKFYPSVVHLLQYNVRPVDITPFCIVICPLYLVIDDVTKQNG